MAKCEICGKQRATGNNVSHAQNKTKRTFEANIQSTVVYQNGQARRVKACTRCIRTMAKSK
jgi:large subunit ribosomal protein L28